MRATLNIRGDSNLASYLYQQYEDDEDLHAFVDAYNTAAQVYLDWFNSIALPYYPGLSGALLNWVAKGLYDLDRTQLASPKTPALGMLNTEILNTATLNAYAPSTQIFYDITDDVFKRILTWDLYKGDGKQFCIRWLKRRIIRFLVGTDGIDPQPFKYDADGLTLIANPDFTVGVESANAVGVVIDPGTNVCAVSIDQSTLSLQINLAPNILQLFKLAFEGGALDLPITYSYAVSIITNFVAIVRPNAVTSSGPSATQTTPAATVSALGGSGIYTYQWAWAIPGIAGGASASSKASGSLSATSGAIGAAAIVNTSASANLITATGGTLAIDSPTAVSTTFSATGLAFGQTLFGFAICTVTDTVSGKTATATVYVSITRTAPAILVLEDGTDFLLESGGFLFTES